MKKYFLASLVALGTLFSCSSDDDSLSSENRILGTWKLVASYDNDGLVEMDECDLKQQLIFTENYNVYYKYYAMINEECILLEKSENKWKNEGGKYYVEFNNNFEFLDVTFSDNNNQMEILYEEEFGNTTIFSRNIYHKQSNFNE